MGTAYQTDKEPELEELFTDPVLLAVLKCDGLSIDDIKTVITSYRQCKDIPSPAPL